MKKIYLFFFCFSCLTFAQNDDPKNNTFYQKGGKIFEEIGSKDTLYRVNISFNDSTKEFTLIRKEPQIRDMKDTIKFTKFDYGVLANRLKELLPGIDDPALNKLINELIESNHSYEMNKIKENFTRLLDKEKRNIGKIGFIDNPKNLSVPVLSDTVPVYRKDTMIVCNDGKKLKLTKVWKENKPVTDTIGIFKVENAQIAFGDGEISKININGTFIPKDSIKVNGKFIQNKDRQQRRMTFYNFSYPIPIRTGEDIDEFNKFNSYWLDAQYEDDIIGYYIYLSDVLYYEQDLIYNYGIYIPPDGKVITLNDAVVEFPLKKESFVNDFDLRIYTDVTGLSADNPNGLIKFMGNYKLNFEGIPLWLPNSPSDKYYGLFIMLDYINLYFNFNKIESDELVLPVKSSNHYLYSTTFDLYRYSKFELGIDWNIINWKREYSSKSCSFLFGVYHTPVDSTFQIENKSVTISDGVNSFYTGLKFNYRFLPNEYVDINMGYSFIIPQLFSNNKIKEIYGPIDDPNSEGNTRKGYLDTHFWIHRFNAELSIFPDPQDRSSFIFLKSILNFNNSDNYMSLLLGYAVPFSNIFAIGQAPK